MKLTFKLFVVGIALLFTSVLASRISGELQPSGVLYSNHYYTATAVVDHDGEPEFKNCRQVDCDFTMTEDSIKFACKMGILNLKIMGTDPTDPSKLYATDYKGNMVVLVRYSPDTAKDDKSQEILMFFSPSGLQLLNAQNSCIDKNQIPLE